MSSTETLTDRAKNRNLIDSPEILVKNLSFGVNLYENTIPVDECYKYVDLLSNSLDSGLKDYSWLPPEEGDEVRTAANDFVVTEEFLGPKNETNKDLYNMNSKVLDVIKTCVSDYASSWGIEIHYYQDLNFVRYVAPTGYFAPHIDDSPHTVRSVSAVLYLNDNYDGGELLFTRLDNLKVKPKPGDLVVFPSTYLYEHKSEVVTRGTKYCVVSFSDLYEKRG
jgi:hypothetical protein